MGTTREQESKAARASAADESSSESENDDSKTLKATLTPQDAELEAAIATIRATKDLPRPPYPTLPNLNAPGSMQTKVNSVQTRARQTQITARPPGQGGAASSRGWPHSHVRRGPTHRRYIEKLSYNFTGVNYFDIRKNRPMTRILETAREITRQVPCLLRVVAHRAAVLI